MSSLRRWLVFVCLGLSFAVLSVTSAAADPALTAKQPFSEILFNECTGELFVASGEIHTSTRASIAADGRLHVTMHSNLQNVKGYGLYTGARYVVQQILAEHTNADGDFAPFNSNSNFLEHYIRQGDDGALIDDDDFFFWIRLHLTVDANGVPRAERIDMDFECR